MKKLIALLLVLITPALAFARGPEDSTSVSRRETIEKLNSLLRGEISAVETYNKAIAKVNRDEPGFAKLTQFKADHAEAVASLQGEIKGLNGTPSTDSGAWGAWANTVQSTANLFGDRSALTALKHGEEHGLKEYNEALLDEEIAPSVKETIRSKFMKNQQVHIDEIDRFIQQIKNS